MITPQRLSAKFFLREPDSFDPAACIPVFHRWIQQQVTDELLIDVADYSHVHNGPAVMLVGLEGEYILDKGAGRPGVRYVRKRALPEGLPAALALTLQQAAVAGRRLESELPDAAVDPGEIEIVLLDRLRYPNTSSAFDAIRSEIQALAAAIYGSEVAVIERVETDERLPLTIRVKAAGSDTLEDLIDRLAALSTRPSHSQSFAA